MEQQREQNVLDTAEFTPFDSLMDAITTPPVTVYDITGMDKAVILESLWTHAKEKPNCLPKGYRLNKTFTEVVNGYSGSCCLTDGIKDFRKSNESYDASSWSVEDGYFRCRFVGTDLSGNKIDLTAYDKVNGAGTGERAMREARGMMVNNIVNK